MRNTFHIKRGIATFTLDEGRCPRWLFERMVRLGREMTEILIDEYGPDEFIRRIADPVWFQSLGTVLAFDWNASGLTTILTAALKEAIRGKERELGVFICGGKGRTSRKTPDQIREWGERLSISASHVENLIYNSRMSAKVDSALIQDGYQIYHHSFFFSLRRAPRGFPQIGSWAVVQQGMNTSNQTARRYHWFSQGITDMVCEPHAGIVSQVRSLETLNLTAKESTKTRKVSTELALLGFRALMKDIRLLRTHASSLSRMVALRRGEEEWSLVELKNTEFTYHPVVHEDLAKSRYLEKILWKVSQEKPKTYERLLSLEGVGPKTIRALSLVAELIYGARPSYEDPARYSFAHGGKDATPFPVDRKTYDETIQILEGLIRKARLTRGERDRAYARLEGLHNV